MRQCIALINSSTKPHQLIIHSVAVWFMPYFFISWLIKNDEMTAMNSNLNEIINGGLVSVLPYDFPASNNQSTKLNEIIKQIWLKTFSPVWLINFNSEVWFHWLVWLSREMEYYNSTNSNGWLQGKTIV